MYSNTHKVHKRLLQAFLLVMKFS